MTVHKPVLVTPPAADDPVVTLAEAKAHLRVDGSDEDGLITALIGAAVAHLDGYAGILGRALVTQTWRQDVDGFCRTMRLPLPAASIASIKWMASDGTTLTTIAGANYALQADALGSFVRFIDDYDFPTDLAETQAVRLEFTAGYGIAVAVPADIKLAILLTVGAWYQNRETVIVGATGMELPLGANALLAKYRLMGI